jgi:pilus assembly protein CpaB
VNRKWIGILVAVVFAAFGTVVLIGYVRSAEERALEGQESAEVLVVAEPVAAGSSAEEIAGKVATELVPAKVQAPGSVASLQEIAGRVAAVDLVPGEQLLAARFVAPEAYATMDDFAIPDGMVEVTISLSPERAVGGALRQGDLVAVFASFDPFDLDGVEPGDEEVVINVQDVVDLENILGSTPQSAQTPNSTHLVIHKVVVTNVQVERLPTDEENPTDGDAGVALAPTGNLLVTLAMAPPNAERFVFTAEFGTVWLAHEAETATETGTRIQTRNTVYEDVASSGVTP